MLSFSTFVRKSSVVNDTRSIRLRHDIDFRGGRLRHDCRLVVDKKDDFDFINKK